MADAFEGWAIVEGFPAYEVSDRGRVRRIGRAARNGAGHGGGARIGRVLKAHEVAPGSYLVVQLWRDGRPSTRLVHCLVAAAFIRPCPPGHEVNHKDGDKQQPAAWNLEYLTRPDNMRHAYRTGLRQVTIAQAVAARRKPRVLIACACGCGEQIETPDSKGRDRRFMSGHNMRSAA